MIDYIIQTMTDLNLFTIESLIYLSGVLVVGVALYATGKKSKLKEYIYDMVVLMEAKYKGSKEGQKRKQELINMAYDKFVATSFLKYFMTKEEFCVKIDILIEKSVAEMKEMLKK